MAKFELNKEKYLGNTFIELGNKRIDLPAPIQYIETFSEESIPKIVILYSLTTCKIGLEPKDNIHCYNKDGELLWTLKDLISKYKETLI